MNKPAFNERLRKGQAHLKQGQALYFATPPEIEGAIESFRSVTELAPKWNEGFNWLGSALHQQGKLEEAVKMFRRAIELDAKDSRPLISLGLCFVAMGRLSEAIQNFQKGIELKPHYAEADARLMLANALEQNGKMKDAVVEWKKVAGMEGFYPSGDLPMIEAKAKLAEHGGKIG